MGIYVSKEELAKAGIDAEALSPADTVSLIFHPIHKEILVIYTKKDTPICSGKQMIFHDLDTAMVFLRGVAPNIIDMPTIPSVSPAVEEKASIGFTSGLAKAA